MQKRRTKNVSTWLSVLLLFGMILGIPAPGFAQSSEDVPGKVYLPLITGGNQAAVQTDAADVIPGQYVVVFADELVSAASVQATAAELATSLGGELLHTYDAALSGFAVKLPTTASSDALAALQSDPRVSYVEPDRLVMLDPIEVPEALAETPAEAADETVDESVSAAEVAAIDITQPNPPWGLDRIDQRNLPLNSQYNYNNTGSGVRVYIIDTGINITHNEFQGRASYGVDLFDGSLPANDCNGHGTHVAGTVGGRTYGVAKGVQLIAVRVFGCSGGTPSSTVIAAVNWVTNQKRANPSVPMVANMSLGGSFYAPTNSAVQASIAAGVSYAVSAGNDYGLSACAKSPASTPQALTVAATDSNDIRAGFSNIGNCVDLFAPGVSVLSAWYTSNTAAAYLNGTSMATPHVAGAAALYLQSNAGATPAQVANAIVSNATTNVVGNPGTGSPNRLLYINAGSTPPPTNCFPEYNHLPAILGTPANDTLYGTSGAERICGFLGKDVLLGGDGNDAVHGNEGNDSVYGEIGNDNVTGGKDNDFVDGGEGNDEATGGIGNDRVYGGMNVDMVYGNDGNDTVGGGEDNDFVYGDPGNDQVYGGNGDDNLWGGTGRDTFHYTLGHGNDIIHDFVWGTDRLRLYSVSIHSYSQLGGICQLNLSSGATIRLANVGACRNPTVAASMATVLPTIRATYNPADSSVVVHGSGFAAQEVVPLALHDAGTVSVAADAAGSFTYTTSVAEIWTDEYVITVPTYTNTAEEEGIEVNTVATLVELAQ